MKKSIILATRNAHKVQELKALLGEGWDVKGVADFPDLPEIDETGRTFLANATLKAEGISARVEGWVLADDSGIEVDALGGEPGVDSAHYGGFPRSDAKNNRKVLDELKKRGLLKPEERTARYKCILALARGGKVEASFEGSCEGRIDLHQRGQNGFGYDPMFIPQGEKKSFGELSDEIKNRISHRAQAFEMFKIWMEKAPG